jgi:hypothetical protein
MNHPEAQQYEDAAPGLQRSAAAACAAEEIALTHFCKPRRGFRAWQYTKNATAFPKWVSEYLLVQPGGQVSFQYPDNGHDFTLEEGQWVVLFDHQADAVALYDASEFAEVFECVTPPA